MTPGGRGCGMQERTTQEQAERIIDVVEDFACPQQTDRYRTAFRSWRRRKGNPYALRFTRNPKETSFSEDRTVVKETPAHAEQAVLYRLGYLIGFSMLLYPFVEYVLQWITVTLLRATGHHIEMVFWGRSHLFGNELAVFWLAVMLYAMKYLVPTVAIVLMLRLPAAVSYPLHVQRPEMLLHGFGSMLVLDSLAGALRTRHSVDLDRYRILSDGATSSDQRLVVYLLLSIFVLPLISELLLHGGMFQVLRQFGDLFAAVTVSLLAALLMHHVADGLRIGLVTLVLSVYMLHTGSFWTAVFLRLVHEVHLFALYFLISSGEQYTLRWWLTLLVPCLIGAAVILFVHSFAGTPKPPLYRNRTYLRISEKVNALFNTLPMAAFLIVSILLTIVTAMLG